MHAGQDSAPPREPTPPVSDHLWQALGRAAAQCWSGLPQEVQRALFDAAVTAEGEAIRQELAIFLHDKHSRTLDAVHANATIEPDSLGG
jgi:hypothetical protein